MQKFIALLTMLVMTFGMTVSANCQHCGQDYYLCYENNPCDCEQSCAPCCNPCDLCAPVCGTNCGLSVCSIAAAIAAVVGVAAIILASPGASTVHSHNP